MPPNGRSSGEAAGFELIDKNGGRPGVRLMKQPKKDHWVRRVGNRCKPSLRMLPSVIGRPASDVWPSRRTPPRANNGTTITLKFAAVSSEPAVDADGADANLRRCRDDPAGRFRPCGEGECYAGHIT